LNFIIIKPCKTFYVKLSLKYFYFYKTSKIICSYKKLKKTKLVHGVNESYIFDLFFLEFVLGF